MLYFLFQVNGVLGFWGMWTNFPRVGLSQRGHTVRNAFIRQAKWNVQLHPANLAMSPNSLKMV
jgi:hypothetical protein